MSRDELIEQVVGAFRHRSGRGEIRPHAAWSDLDEAARGEAFDLTLEARRLEAALDPQGISTTGHAVLTAIRGD